MTNVPCLCRSCDPKLKARLADIGGAPMAGTHADFGNLVATETEKWGNVVKFAGMKPDIQ
jgi:hypothetical protein